jgi:hypothetical protein
MQNKGCGGCDRGGKGVGCTCETVTTSCDKF